VFDCKYSLPTEYERLDILANISVITGLFDNIEPFDNMFDNTGVFDNIFPIIGVIIAILVEPPIGTPLIVSSASGALLV